MAEKRDYYEVLGVSKDAPDHEIKKSFRKLARKYHPDVNPGDQSAEENFKEINDAYETLSDPQKRQQYDQFGHDGPQFNGFGGAGAGDFGDIGDIFSMFFGGNSSGFGGASGGPRRGSDLRYDLSIEFEEAVFGSKQNISIKRMKECDTCYGTGAAKGSAPRKCGRCGGTGRVVQTQQTPFGRMQTQGVCPDCQGSGEIIDKPCTDCGGTGRKQQTTVLEVSIPAGVDNGTRLRMQGEGEAGEHGGPSGDLYIYIHVRAHEIFERSDNDIFMEQPVNVAQAALGDEIEVPTMEGRIKFKIPAGVQSGTRFRLKGKGIKGMKSFGRGDQYVTVIVQTPKSLSDKQRALFEELSMSLDRLDCNDKKEDEKSDSENKGFFGKFKETINDIFQDEEE